MTALLFLIVLGLVFAAVWGFMSRNPGPRAKLGPDGTNVREPETFVVHHEGKGQGLDIANTALKERTEDVRRDLPGDAHKVKAPVPGRDMVRMSDPPSDQSRYGDQKVAPGAEPKEKVLMEGPVGSRPETPEEPGSPYAKGRRVTDNHRDVELAADLLPSLEPGQSRVDSGLAASPSTNGQEPGYGLGKTAYNETDGEGGLGDPDLANFAEGDRGDRRAPRSMGKVLEFRSRAGSDAAVPEDEDEEITLPDPTSAHELGAELDWSGLDEDLPMPAATGEDTIVATVRNPHSLYLYFGRGEREANLRAALGEAEWRRTTPCVRIVDLTEADGDTIVAVSDADDHLFINSVRPGHRYMVSYGRRDSSGKFHEFSHSAPVQTPFGAPDATVESDLLYQMYARQPGHAGSEWR